MISLNTARFNDRFGSRAELNGTYRGHALKQKILQVRFETLGIPGTRFVRVCIYKQAIPSFSSARRPLGLIQ